MIGGRALARLSIAGAVALAMACGQGAPDLVLDPATTAQPEPEAGIPEPGMREPDTNEPDTNEMEPQVKARLLETRSAALASPLSAETWGRYGMVAHAHDLWNEAARAYRQARKLDPTDERWPYYLGDVLSVQGTELGEAVEAFRRALTLLPDYAPAHMRLGNVLIALDRSSEAAVELTRALELAPALQPARVALAQVRLAEGELDLSEKLLDEVLREAPRHGQALATLGRVYMRQGRRREEARAIATRARSAASYNLYSDPLMGRVVAEGVSAVQIWERAKSFLENGNYEQAALGLRQVVLLQPSNTDAHLQLAITYGNLGDLERSRVHLERTVVLDPGLVAARIHLAMLLLEQESPAPALEHLERALALDPDNAEAGWLLAKALLQTGDLAGALTVFDRTRQTDGPTAGPAADRIPAWVHNEWGRAMAQTGQPQDALAHFRAALAENPEDAQALFYLGLVLEGLGRTADAVASYCRSMAAKANPPAGDRLQALGRSCP
ncbi:MAG: tetratricopeptide repeat protein [Acidobacteria bacterium]|nr:tetratricopeptide repeat protein [Acidobacteriota bacterium]